MIEGLNTEYMKTSGGVKIPALQATTYKPDVITAKAAKAMDKAVLSSDYVKLENGDYIQRIDIAIAEESFNLIPTDQSVLLNSQMLQTEFKNKQTGKMEEVTLFVLDPGVRWIPLAYPKLHFYDKTERKFLTLQKGEKLGNGKVTKYRVLFAGITPDGNVIRGENGEPQVFGLTLDSFKARDFIGDDRNKSETGTLLSLNRAINDTYKTSGWQSHLVSVGISISVKEYQSSLTTDSSQGLSYVLGGAKALNDENQKLMTEFVQTENFKTLAKNPFGLKEQPGEHDTHHEDAGDTHEELPSQQPQEKDKFSDIPF